MARVEKAVRCWNRNLFKEKSIPFLEHRSAINNVLTHIMLAYFLIVRFLKIMKLIQQTLVDLGCNGVGTTKEIRDSVLFLEKQFTPGNNITSSFCGTYHFYPKTVVANSFQTIR